MALFFDVETTGLPIRGNLPYGINPVYNKLESYNNARIVQITIMLCDENLNEIELKNQKEYENQVKDVSNIIKEIKSNVTNNISDFQTSTTNQIILDNKRILEKITIIELELNQKMSILDQDKKEKIILKELLDLSEKSKKSLENKKEIESLSLKLEETQKQTNNILKYNVDLNDEFIEIKNKINLVESVQTQEQKSLIKTKDHEVIIKNISESLSTLELKLKNLEQADITIKG